MRWRAAEGYMCTKLGERDYLLPYGQKIADFHVGLQVNETGKLIWNALEKGAEEEEILRLLCGHFEAEREDIPQLQRDMQEFLRNLEARGAAFPERRETSPGAAAPLFFRAGSLLVAYAGPEKVFRKYLRDFACEGGEADQRVEILLCRPSTTANGVVLVRSDDLILMERETGYVMLLPVFPDIYEMHVSRDGSMCRIYCRPEMREEELGHIFHVMRFAFLVLAQNRGLTVVHSASLLYREKAWLFSGQSGTGKSTHTNLWHDAWGVPILNGDLNCLGTAAEKVWVYGLPWCGTSGIAAPEAYPLGGVVFLRQWKENLVQELSEPEKISQLAMRMVTPTWTAALLSGNLALSERIVRQCMAVRLCCTKEPAAAEVMRQYIDNFCDEEQGRVGARGNGQNGSGQD